MALKYRGIALILASSLIISGCETTNPYTGEQQTSNATKGGLIGAGVGVLVGLATGDNSKERRNRAIALGMAGGLAGTGIGYNADQTEAKLRNKLESQGVRVIREGDNIRLVMPNSITFDKNEATLKPQAQDTIEAVALVLQEFSAVTARVNGHTDNTGSRKLNERLSLQRAEKVGIALGRQGIAMQRISMTGYAFDLPLASNSTAEGRAQNRRVEIYLVNPPPQ
ncbi:OmpA family protein [Oceanospirillum sediminis]|uniref:OmpA family protein n=1 Tax=Oceanospirillum sediminis TaxID=2760088 RepID=A0A839IV21_9GAMM|nr:OmpA family protein [Oceanospirillum sediminis]MBB1488510.1 OmpA family protein [Oceanospirillum sediminis]